MDEYGQVHQEAFKELRTATDLALRAMKAMAQAIGKTMASFGQPLVKPHWDQGRWEDGFPRLTGFAEGPVRPRCGRVCRKVFVGSEDVASAASLPFQAPWPLWYRWESVDISLKRAPRLGPDGGGLSITKAVSGHTLFVGWLVASSFGHRKNSSR